MKVGDYVRTEKGKIDKYNPIWVEHNKFEDRYYYVYPDKEDYYDHYELIIKSSPNILELLEEHDFITIEYYSLRYDERVTRIFEVGYKDKEFTTLKNAYCDFMLKNNEFNDSDKELEPIIKSVLTHEAFSQNEFIVEK